MSTPEENRRLLAHAAARCGGIDGLADRLQISARVLSRYLTNSEPIPDALILKTLDILMDQIAKARDHK